MQVKKITVLIYWPTAGSHTADLPVTDVVVTTDRFALTNGLKIALRHGEALLF